MPDDVLSVLAAEPVAPDRRRSRWYEALNAPMTARDVLADAETVRDLHAARRTGAASPALERMLSSARSKVETHQRTTLGVGAAGRHVWSIRSSTEGRLDE